MGRAIFVTLVLCLFTSSGCMIIDELDSANAQMKSFQKKKPENEADGSESLAAKARKSKNELLQQSKAWWNEATSLAPGEADARIVTCRIGGSEQFMSKDDCLTQGGVPKGVSG